MKAFVSHLADNAGAGLKVVNQTATLAVLAGGITLAHDEIDTTATALCTVAVRHDWQDVIPLVRCHEPWLREDVNWHVPGNRLLCLDLNARWRDFINLADKMLSRAETEKYAAAYLLHSTRSLLFRHLYGYQLGLQVWPTEWDAWAHYREGLRQYQTLRKN